MGDAKKGSWFPSKLEKQIGEAYVESTYLNMEDSPNLSLVVSLDGEEQKKLWRLQWAGLL